MPPPVHGPALGLFELESLARGVVVADALVKQATVQIVVAEAVTPGKYLLLFVGREGEVAESYKAGATAGGGMVLDSLHLPHISEILLAAVVHGELAAMVSDEAVGVVELHTIAATLKAADAALKRANVKLTQLHLAKGIGGKGWFTLAGLQSDVEAALQGAAEAVQAHLLVATELIARPHAELRGRVL